MLNISYIQETEEQRYGRNKHTSINHTYIQSGTFRKKFDCISNDKTLNRIIFQLAKKCYYIAQVHYMKTCIG